MLYSEKRRALTAARLRLYLDLMPRVGGQGKPFTATGADIDAIYRQSALCGRHAQILAGAINEAWDDVIREAGYPKRRDPDDLLETINTGTRTGGYTSRQIVLNMAAINLDRHLQEKLGSRFAGKSSWELPSPWPKHL